ncbi:hypothetical protein Sru01_28730 [Sphaerisporangium rufum]|uniref:Cell envelope-related transcriptional attenuator domain-containing protein n=1 Tax=Sphaerisporangium rufum TaxID=1381558 RepID=A0A919UYB9_9ACTN|nr:LCP family protein [Sphaerisporangium rufum]GII77891.1 hypothetical protein Sru01_28730 [Sphaerisporangium rufum]
MDDLKMLRDLGRDLEHEPADLLARQRDRLLAMSMAGSGPDHSGRRARLPRTTRAGRSAGGGLPVRRRRWAWAAAAAAVAAVTVAIAVVPAMLVRGSVPAARVVAGPSWDRPAKQGTSTNVLLVASDRPSPQSGLGVRADAIMLLHLAADPRRTMVITIPRRSVVRIPSCPAATGGTAPRLDMINRTLDIGGLECVWKTVESLTGLHVDHAVEVGYSGFAAIVDAMGGVSVKLPAAIDDPKAKLRLPAGTSVLDGAQALGYVRSRAAGDGSDLARTRRQAALLLELLRKATAESVLDDPARLARLLEAVSRSITTDRELDVATMTSMAQALGSAGPDIRFVDVPWEPYVNDRNLPQWKQPEADRLFATLAKD